MLSVGNDFTRQHFAGNFLMSPSEDELPALSLVFVQSREGNTVAQNPADLGGGDTDLNLIYEGLSRVAADGVMAGARTATGRVLFSVWQPDIVDLRYALGLPRHPAQIVVSYDGKLDVDQTLLFHVPSVPVFVIAGPGCRERCGTALDRPGVTVIPAESRDLTIPLRELKRHGIQRISAVGGRSTASALIDAGLVKDLYLTTTRKSAGKPGTPYYAGSHAPRLDTILRKRLIGSPGEAGIQFEHLKITAR